MLDVSLVTTPWHKMASGWPDQKGEYLVVVQASNGQRYVVIAYYDNKYIGFEYYDFYDDSPGHLHKKDVFAWMKIPDYKNL